MGVLTEAIMSIWSKDIVTQPMPQGTLTTTERVIPPTQNVCEHCNSMYGKHDFHDCIGEFDAYRIYIGAATNSVWARYSRGNSVRAADRAALSDHARSEIESLPMAEFNGLVYRYDTKMKSIDDPNLSLEDELWNS